MVGFLLEENNVEEGPTKVRICNPGSGAGLISDERAQERVLSCLSVKALSEIVAPASANEVSSAAPSTCRVGSAQIEVAEKRLGASRYPMPQISAQMWNLWLLEALSSAAVT